MTSFLKICHSEVTLNGLIYKIKPGLKNLTLYVPMYAQAVNYQVSLVLCLKLLEQEKDFEDISLIHSPI